MTRRYRMLVEAVFSGVPMDTCPVSLWQHQPEVDQNAETFAAATLAFQARFDCDLIKVSPASTYQLRDYGLKDAWQHDPMGRRSVLKTVINYPEDWLSLPRLDPRQGFCGRIVAATKIVQKNAVSLNVPVLVTVFNPLFQAITLAGRDLFDQHVLAYPAAVDAGIARLAENTQDLINCLATEAHLDGIFLASQHAHRAAMTRSLYVLHGLPSDLACLQASNGLPLNFLHLHGRAVYAGLYDEVREVILHYEPDLENPSAEELLARGRAVSTGPDVDLFVSDTSIAQISLHCRSILARCKGPRFMLAPGCTVALGVDAMRLRAVVESARMPMPDRPLSEQPYIV